MGWLPAQRLHQKFCLMYQTLSKQGEGRRARGGTEGVPRTTPTSRLPSSSREAPGSSLPFDLCLSRRAFHHILVDLNHRKAAARGTKDARCSSGATTFLSIQDPLFPGTCRGPAAPGSQPGSFSTSSAGIMAAATQILRVPDCNLKYQPKATLTAEICSVG